MKKMIYFFALCVVCLTSCSSDDEDPKSYVKVDGKVSLLQVGDITAYKGKGGLGLNDYAIILADKFEGGNTSVQLTISSTSDDGLAEGTYEFDRFLAEGKFNEVFIGTDLVLDAEGEVTEGNQYEAVPEISSGSLVVSKVDGSYQFDLKMSLVGLDKKTHNIELRYTEALEENEYVEVFKNYVQVDGESFKLNVGSYYDEEANSNGSRERVISLRDKEENKSVFLSFVVRYNTEGGLKEGTYKCAFRPKDGECTDVIVMTNMKYDAEGEMTESNDYFEEEGKSEGALVVSKEGDNYKFDLKVTLIDDDEKMHTIEAFFGEPLTKKTRNM